MSDHPVIAAAGMLAPSILVALQPDGPAWREAQPPPMHHASGLIAIRRFVHPRGYNVLSCVESVTGEHGRGAQPQYHISISKWNPGTQRNERCPSDEAQWIIKCFKLDGWEEDNHVPGGRVRNFWRPVAENDVGRECVCKASEPAISEDKGDYIWRPTP